MTKLLEIVQSRELRVDQEAGMIRGVRILGPISGNGRKYLPEAVAKAVDLYEGRAVNLNHPSREDPLGERAIADRFGWLENVHVEAGGLSGDLMYLKTHSQAESIAEAAERNPRLFGLSHNAEGKTSRENGTTIVEEITDVHSVDIVSDPATTKSLFESQTQREKPMKKTIQQILDGLKRPTPKSRRLARLMEQVVEEQPAAEVMAAEVAEPMEIEPEVDPNEEIVMAMEKAAVGIIKAMFAGEIEESEAFSKLKELLGIKEKVVEEPTTTETPAAEVAAAATESINKGFKMLGKKLDRFSEALKERPMGGLRESGGNGDDDWKPPTDPKEFLRRVKG